MSKVAEPGATDCVHRRVMWDSCIECDIATGRIDRRSFAVCDRRLARDFECPVCGGWPQVDIHDHAYDCNGQTLETLYRHPWAQPVRRPFTAVTLPGHEQHIPWSLVVRWRREHASHTAASTPEGSTDD